MSVNLLPPQTLLRLSKISSTNSLETGMKKSQYTEAPSWLSLLLSDQSIDVNGSINMNRKVKDRNQDGLGKLVS